MAHDKKIYLSILLFFLIALRGALTVWHSPLSFDVDSKRRVDLFQVNLSNKSYEGLILGGSNAIWGINSSPYGMSPNNIIANLAINHEGYSWINYANFLISLNVQSNWALYSSYDVLQLSDTVNLDDDSANLIGEKEKYIFFGNTRLINIIKSAIAPVPINIAAPAYEIDVYGNASNFTCTPNSVRPLSFQPFSIKKGEIVLARVNRLKKILGTNKIILRFPPVYVKQGDLSKWNSYLVRLKNFMESNGVIFFSHDVSFYPEKSLFCDAPHHPNGKLQQELSIELFSSHKILSIRAKK